MASSYSELQASLAVVRNAWKLTAMVKGLAKTVVEAVGVVFIFVMIDWLYALTSSPRLILLLVGGGFLAYVFAREVLAPALKHIPDDQLALYVEERYPECDGSVMAATEFGRATESSGLYGYVVNALVEDAVGRTRRVNLRRLVELKGFRKYGMAAFGLVVFFLANSLVFPTFRAQSVRVLAPWTTIEEERLAALKEGPAGFYDLSYAGPIQFKVEPGDARVVRGGSVRITGVLSRQPEEGAAILFRSASSEKWQSVGMAEIDRLYGYSGRLTDVTEDIEYRMGSGPIFRSEAFKVTVYDPLAVKALEITSTYPEYLEMEPVVTLGTSGDISAPVGSTALVRIIGNHPIGEGELVFEDGTKLPLAGGDTAEAGATCELPIETDTSYTFRIVSKEGEELSSAEYFYVRALPDKPPTIEVLSPKADITVHYLSEITFSTRIADDFGIKQAELVYKICEPDSQKEFTVPLSWGDEKSPQEATAEFVMCLEDLVDPKIVPDQIVFYHLRTKDKKGQEAVSDIYNVTIARLETPGFWPKDRGHAPSGQFEGPQIEIMVFVAACWDLEQRRGKIAEEEFSAACDKIYRQLADVQDPTKPLDFVGAKARPFADPRMLSLHDAKVLAGWNLLKENEPGKAAEELRMAYVFQKRAFPMGIFVAKAKWQGVGNPYNEQIMDNSRSHVSFDANMEFIDTNPGQDPELPPEGYLSRELEYRRKLNNERQQAAAEATEKADQIAREQEDIAERARELADEEEQAPEDQAVGEETEEADAEDQADAGGEEDPNAEPGDEDQADAGGEEDPNAEPGDEDQADAGGEEDPNSEPGENDEENGDQAKSERERLVDDQMKLADAVRKAAERFARQTDTEDKESMRVMRDLRDAARTMDMAAADFKHRKYDRGALKADQAKKMVEMAAKKLRATQFESLEEAINAAEDAAAELLRRQDKVNEAAKSTYKEAVKRAEREAKRTRPDGTKPTKEEALRDILENPPTEQNIKKLAEEQAKIYQETEKLTEYLKDLAKWAAQARKEDAEKELNRVNKDIAQRRFPQKMVDAVINLNQRDIPKALEAQADATDTLKRVSKGLQQASDSLAGTKESLLRRAARQAEQVAEQAEKLDPKRKDETGKGEPGEEEPDETRKPDENGEKDPTKKGDASEEDKDKKPITDPAERERATAELLIKTRRLVRYLEDEKLVDKKVTDYLKRTSKSEKGFREMFGDEGKERAARFVTVTTAARVNLQKSLSSLLDQKRLRAAQREDCPAKYRKLVNGYFEALSGGKTK